MTSLETRHRTSDTDHGGTEPMSSRLRRGVPLLLGAALVLLVLEPVGELPLRGWVPV